MAKITKISNVKIHASLCRLIPMLWLIKTKTNKKFVA